MSFLKRNNELDITGLQVGYGWIAANDLPAVVWFLLVADITVRVVRDMGLKCSN